MGGYDIDEKSHHFDENYMRCALYPKGPLLVKKVLKITTTKSKYTDTDTFKKPSLKEITKYHYWSKKNPRGGNYIIYRVST